ncbi:hypothetical protein PR048_021890 [Dryococelus australis]|uniref:Uncharacterized protein n=1 Tax=Dryococelus australis TaxID=614101 RepID=A0ABQ9GZI9_9NEOP|nr:hypothetical protein PR048_021890 [Dryococelus australis]
MECREYVDAQVNSIVSFTYGRYCAVLYCAATFQFSVGVSVQSELNETTFVQYSPSFGGISHVRSCYPCHRNPLWTPCPDCAFGVCPAFSVVHSLYDLPAPAELLQHTHANMTGGGTGDPREKSPTNDIIRHYSHIRKSGVTRPEIEPGSPWWEASRRTAQPPWPLGWRIGVLYNYGDSVLFSRAVTDSTMAAESIDPIECGLINRYTAEQPGSKVVTIVGSGNVGSAVAYALCLKVMPPDHEKQSTKMTEEGPKKPLMDGWGTVLRNFQRYQRNVPLHGGRGGITASSQYTRLLPLRAGVESRRCQTAEFFPTCETWRTGTSFPPPLPLHSSIAAPSSPRFAPTSANDIGCGGTLLRYPQLYHTVYRMFKIMAGQGSGDLRSRGPVRADPSLDFRTRENGLCSDIVMYDIDDEKLKAEFLDLQVPALLGSTKIHFATSKCSTIKTQPDYAAEIKMKIEVMSHKSFLWMYSRLLPVFIPPLTHFISTPPFLNLTGTTGLSLGLHQPPSVNAIDLLESADSTPASHSCRQSTFCLLVVCSVFAHMAFKVVQSSKLSNSQKMLAWSAEKWGVSATRGKKWGIDGFVAAILDSVMAAILDDITTTYDVIIPMTSPPQ